MQALFKHTQINAHGNRNSRERNTLWNVTDDNKTSGKKALSCLEERKGKPFMAAFLGSV